MHISHFTHSKHKHKSTSLRGEMKNSQDFNDGSDMTMEYEYKLNDKIKCKMLMSFPKIAWANINHKKRKLLNNQ